MERGAVLLLVSCLVAVGAEIFSAERNVRYELTKELEVGDTITAWGVYSSIATSKFSVNIVGANNLFLLHVDFRPYNDVVVLNSYVTAWQTEIRPAFSRNNFENNKIFKVCIEVYADAYRILFNGEELAMRFPLRIALSSANAVVLHGGSDGFQWSALHLPTYLEAPGLPFSSSSGTVNTLELPLVPGDSVTAWGIYGTASSKFSVNLLKEGGEFMIHVDFRPPPNEDKVVLNSKITEWQSELRTTLPNFVNGQIFKVEVLCLVTEFKIFVDEVELGITFPYRDGFALSDVTNVQLHGGSEGMTWTDLQFPATNDLGSSLLVSTLTTSQNSVTHGGVSSRAIDGNTNGIWGSGTCTHTPGGSNWWSVRLAQNSAVTKVILHNRKDCCQNRLDGAKVYVGDVYCGQVSYVDSQSVYAIGCGGAVGVDVKVIQDNNILTLCEVQVFGTPSDETPVINIAPGLPTWQSTEGWSGVPSRATDGNRNGVYGSKTCTHSANAGFNIWKVALIDKYEIDSVVIHNRIDCCQSRLNGAKVYVNKQECGTVEYKAGQNVYVIDCGGIKGTAVQITQDGEYLTLCEVEVLAKRSESQTRFINVALSGRATQDSIGWSGEAARAIDGNTDGDYWQNSCSHNGDLTGSWWNVELTEAVPISKVVIYNREDCCQDRIDRAKVYVDDVLCGTINYVEGQTVYREGCNSNELDYVVGQNVKIVGKDGTYLTLCEVQVLSDPLESASDNLVNLAYLKPTSQSSTGWSGVSSRAVDGGLSTKYSKGTCTHTSGSSGWWKVDLENNYNVEKIAIKNRMDCCSERLDGVQVYVGDILCGTVEHHPLKVNYEFECGIVGSYVKIVNANSYLTLCEVKVFGKDEVIDISTDRETTGDRSGTADDAQSRATCDAGYVVSYCEAQTGLVHTKCDGAFVDDTGATCVAVNGYGGNGAIARAICSPNDQVADPCNGPNLPTYKRLHSRGPNPSLSCPSGYTPAVCNARSPWLGKLTNKGVDAKGVIPNTAECKVTGCTDRNWCEVTLVCKLTDDMEAYEAATCPTCDGYHCGDDEECVLLDMDDDADDDEVPTCVQKQTGCDDNDRCGDEGECMPEGRDGYTCECSDDFVFNQITGSCIAVHTIWTLVIGEEAIGDDAISYAECDSGQFVMRCHTYGAPAAADGVYITLDEDGTSTCVARASHARKYGIRAVAYCGDRASITDPCTQAVIHSTEYRYSSSHSPTVACPPGYYMSSCIFHSPWTQNMNSAARAQIRSIGSVDVDDDGVCKVNDCLETETSSNYCKLSAVCTKLTGVEYIQEACPTCEQVRCADDYTCSLGENSLPECNPRIAGGCDTDRCGSGSCIEDGANYTCTCHSGFEFDGETCVDVDECAELPCGNGDCTNNEGSYSCDCQDGYTNDRGMCVDIDECDSEDAGPCSGTERCSNIEGSYVCDCLDTFSRDASGVCVCTDGYENVDDACVDVDECQDAPCKENEDCSNSVGDYQCTCSEGFDRGSDNVCKDFTPVDCEVYAAKDSYSTFAGNNLKVKLKGELKKDFKNYATISWTKDSVLWDPASEDKEKFNGFTIRDFQAQDAGTYVGSIYIEKPDGNFKCEVVVELSLKEGSVTIDIDNRENLAKTIKVGKNMVIKCKVQLTNVNLDEPNNPDNVNWYRVNLGTDDVQMEETDVIQINKKSGTYRLFFDSPQVEDSGTYKCEFDQEGVSASTEISIIVG